MSRPGRINLTNPVNWSHGQNKGLINWWLALPGTRGGVSLRDIAGKNHGTLTNGPTWTTGPNGFGAVSFDGTDDYLTAGISSAVPVVVSFDYYAPAAPSGNPIPLVQGDDAFNSGVWDWGFYHSSSTNLVTHYNGGDNLNLPITAGAWNRILMVRKDGADSMARVYVNGVLAGSSASPAGTLTGSRAVRTLTGGQRSQGILGDIRLVAATPGDSAALAKWDYDQSRRDYPDLLRRVRPVTVAAAGGAPPAGNRRRRVITGASA